RMGYDSFFSIETIDKINKENIKEIKLKNETTYVSLPNPTILISKACGPINKQAFHELLPDVDVHTPQVIAVSVIIGFGLSTIKICANAPP
ncbi:hypothetical protein ACVWDS_22930, partial [Escherichia coli]